MNLMKNRRDEIKVSGASCSFVKLPVPEISVLLPTYNRVEILDKILCALEAQTLSNESFEVLIVDDGSKDNTEQFLSKYVKKTPLHLSYTILEANGGPARARNFGLEMCRAGVILIIGDDIEPDKELVAKHLTFHQEKSDEGAAMLGYVYFPEEMQPNAFMRWLSHEGRKYFFDYDSLKPGQRLDHLYFYTCNVSVKAKLLSKSGWFDESFPFASHEDLELGHRLSNNGMHLIYDPTAKGAHWHMLSVKGIGKRVYLMGYSAHIFWQKVGDNGTVFRSRLRALISRFASMPPFVSLWTGLLRKEYQESEKYPIQWHVLLFLGFFIGLSDAKRKLQPRL